MAVSNGMIPGMSILSWEQMCAENDPGFYQQQLQPWIYEFNSRRRFLQQLPYYSASFAPPLDQALRMDHEVITMNGEIITLNLDQASVEYFNNG